MELIDTQGQHHSPRADGQDHKYVEYWNDDGRPVRVTIKDDRSYLFQAWAKVERWTDDSGYQVIASLAPAEVHKATLPEGAGAAALAARLIDLYTELLRRVRL